MVITISKKDPTPLVVGTDYEITYGENLKAGKGTVIITGKGSYGGTKTLTFTIVPKWLQWLLL